jgi:phosphoserine phosphatase RsbU/P
MSVRPMRILIIEDCDEDRDLYKRLLLQDAGHRYTIFEAETGQRGWELIFGEQPQCILLDYRLPDMDGLQVLDKLRESHTEVEMPAVVFLTSHGSENLAVAAMRRGAIDYLAKTTMTGEELLGCIRRVVARKKNVQRSKRNQEKVLRELSDTMQQLRVAGDIQSAMLPKQSPNVPGFDIAAGCIPAAATGGDFFDYIPMPGGRLGLVMGDVVGHGIGPALLATETRAYLRAFSRSFTSPGAVLVATNQLIYADTAGHRFVTLFFAILDPSDRHLQFCGAGHRAFVLSSTGTVTQIDSEQPPVGLDLELVQERNREITLQPGDMFLLMTDGITESARGGEHIPWPERMFGQDRAIKYLQKNRCKPAEDLVSGLFRKVRQYTKPSTHDDDMTMMIVKTLKDSTNTPN